MKTYTLIPIGVEAGYTPVSGILTGKKDAKWYTANLVLILYICIFNIKLSLLYNRWDVYVVFLFLSFLSLQLHRHAVVVVNFISTLKIIVSVITGLFVLSSSFSSAKLILQVRYGAYHFIVFLYLFIISIEASL